MYLDETAWVAIAFIIFIALVWKKASKAIISILDNRSVLIQNELQEAKSLKEEALEELRKSLQTQKKVSEAEKKIIDTQNTVINDVINVAEEITADVVKKFTDIKYDKSNVKKAIKLASNNILMEK